MSLSTKPYKGARDFYPEDKRLQKYMFNTWRKVVESYGYEEYDAPILEPLDIYLAKTGEEIVNEQTYVFEDRGGRKVVIRPEMTPSVSRMVAAKRQELGYPLRLYSLPNLWRYERPQRGRLREHWQLNVDLFGVESQAAELELITLVDDIFKAFGATEEMYEIRLNHRALVDYILLQYLGLSAEEAYKVGKLIDRMNKMDQPTFLARLDEILSPVQKQNSVAEKLTAILSAKGINDLPDEVKAQDTVKQLAGVLELLAKHDIKNSRFDATLMRGFDYYTGIVFEVYDLDPENNRSMMGGGRYDGLVGLFGVQPLPTVGFGWGDVTLANFLETHKLLPNLKPEADVYIVTLGDVQARPILKELRQAGVNVAVDLSERKLGDQIKTADKKGIDKVLIIGEDELKSGHFTLKVLSSGQESKLTIRELCEQLTTL